MNTTTALQKNVAKIADYVAEGKALQAMEEFYADDVIMIETNGESTTGLKENLAREMEFFSKILEMKSSKFIDAVCAGTPEDGTVITVVDGVYVHADYGEISSHQASITTWKNGKVIKEVYYLDGGQSA